MCIAKIRQAHAGSPMLQQSWTPPHPLPEERNTKTPILSTPQYSSVLLSLSSRESAWCARFSRDDYQRCPSCIGEAAGLGSGWHSPGPASQAGPPPQNRMKQNVRQPGGECGECGADGGGEVKACVRHRAPSRRLQSTSAPAVRSQSAQDET